MRLRSRLVGLLWRWHRRLGVLAGVFVLLLAVTGILLNHTSTLGLDRSFVGSAWLDRAYGDESADLPAYQLGTHWLTRAANGRVYLTLTDRNTQDIDTRDVSACNGPLVGALSADGLLLAACAEELLLLTGQGELVESVSPGTGLPHPLQGLGLVGERVVVQVAGEWWLADLEQMDFSQRAPAGGSVIRQLVPDRLPDAVRAHLPEPEQWLTWERVVLDLHSGRLFGRIGVLWVDFIGVLLCSLALSGTAMWLFHRRRRQRLAAGD